MKITKIMLIKFYAPDFASFTDSRLVNGHNYKIRVPLYNTSFKNTGDFKVHLSWVNNLNNISTSNKNLIGKISMSLGGWDNEKNNNKG